MLGMNIIEVTIDELVERYSALLFDAYGCCRTRWVRCRVRWN